MTLKPGGLFFLGPAMHYEKPALTLGQQVLRWRERGIDLVRSALPPRFVPAMSFPPDWQERPAWRQEGGE